jgi:hypothetical protein
MLGYINEISISLAKNYNEPPAIYDAMLTIELNKADKNIFLLLYNFFSKGNNVIIASNLPYSNQEIKKLKMQGIDYFIKETIIFTEPNDFDSFFLICNMDVEYWDILFYRQENSNAKDRIIKLSFDSHYNYKSKADIDLINESECRILIYQGHKEILIFSDISKLIKAYNLFINNIFQL